MEPEEVWYKIQFQEPGMLSDPGKIEGVIVSRSATWSAVRRELIKQSEVLKDYTAGMMKLYASEEHYNRHEEICNLSELIGHQAGKEGRNPFIVSVSAVNPKKPRQNANSAHEFSVWFHTRPGIPFDDCFFGLGELRPSINSSIDIHREELEKVKASLRADQFLYRKLAITSTKIPQFIEEQLTWNRQNLAALQSEIHYLCTNRDSLLSWTDTPREELADLDKGDLRFVGRTDTISELLEIHNLNFFRTGGKTSGPAKRIPFIDNLEGMGKSSLARNYIAHLMESLGNSHPAEFRQSILAARTVVVNLAAGSLLKSLEESEEKCEEKAAVEFITTIEGMCGDGEIQGSTTSLRSCLLDPKPFRKVITRFIHETGRPLFLVFDEMGAAFTKKINGVVDVSRDQLDYEKRSFINFCTSTLIPAMQVSHFHILLIGGAGFMELIGNRHNLNSVGIGSRKLLARIGLDMIHREFIPTILAQTYRMKDDRCVTLEDFYGLGAVNQEKYDKFVTALVAGSNGQPRPMFQMLSESKTYEELINAAIGVSESLNHIGELDNWFSSLIPHQACIRKFLRIACDSSVHKRGRNFISLIGLSLPEINGSLSLLEVAARARFRWEGTVEKARLFVTKGVKRQLSIFFLAFRAFISEVRPNSPIEVDYFTNFEKCCGKRFQELFPQGLESRVGFANVEAAKAYSEGLSQSLGVLLFHERSFKWQSGIGD